MALPVQQPQIHIEPLQSQPGNVQNIAEAYERDTRWIKAFSPLEAIKHCFAEWEKKSSSRTTRNTLRQYRMALYDFLEFAGAIVSADQEDPTRMDGDVFDFTSMTLHTPRQINRYITEHCIQKHRRSSSTIKKMLAPVRTYIKALRSQPFLGVQGATRLFVMDCKDLFDLSLQVDPPAAETKSTEGAAKRRNWLNQTQFNEIISQIDRNTLSGKRDAAYFHLLLTGLRVAEMAQITPSTIRPGKKTPWEIKVRGKGNNMDEVALDQQGYTLLMDYIIHYNRAVIKKQIEEAKQVREEYPATAGFVSQHIQYLQQKLEADELTGDPRHIRRNTPVWQPLENNDAVYQHGRKVGTATYKPANGLSTWSLRKITERRTPPIVRKQLGLPEGKGITPHDIRATLVLNLHENGCPVGAIQRQVRHQNLQTTSKYIGPDVDLNRAMLTNYWTLNYSPIQQEL